MSASTQTLIAGGLVALAGIYLLRSWLRKKSPPGCGGACGTVSPEIRQLQKLAGRKR
jgi:hypothetical protein